MLNFQYFTPTKVVFGKDAELKVGPLVKEKGVRKFWYIMVDKVLKSLDCWTESAKH